MEKEEIRSRVLKSFEDCFHASVMSSISDTDNLKDHLELDSYALMTLLVSLSRKFSISFNQVDIGRMKNIESVVTLITEKLSQKERS